MKGIHFSSPSPLPLFVALFLSVMSTWIAFKACFFVPTVTKELLNKDLVQCNKKKCPTVKIEITFVCISGCTCIYVTPFQHSKCFTCLKCKYCESSSSPLYTISTIQICWQPTKAIWNVKAKPPWLIAQTSVEVSLTTTSLMATLQRTIFAFTRLDPLLFWEHINNSLISELRMAHVKYR